MRNVNYATVPYVGTCTDEYCWFIQTGIRSKFLTQSIAGKLFSDQYSITHTLNAEPLILHGLSPGCFDSAGPIYVSRFIDLCECIDR